MLLPSWTPNIIIFILKTTCGSLGIVNRQTLATGQVVFRIYNSYHVSHDILAYEMKPALFKFIFISTIPCRQPNNIDDALYLVLHYLIFVMARGRGNSPNVI